MLVWEYLHAGELVAQRQSARGRMNSGGDSTIFGQIFEQDLRSNWIAQYAIGSQRYMAGFLSNRAVCRDQDNYANRRVYAIPLLCGE